MFDFRYKRAQSLFCFFHAIVLLKVCCFFCYVQGTLGFEQTIDHSIKMARYLAGAIKEREGFQLIQEVKGNACTTE